MTSTKPPQKKVAQDKSMSDDKLKPGEGPSKAEREAGSYDVLFIATNEQGQSVKVVSGHLPLPWVKHSLPVCSRMQA